MSFRTPLSKQTGFVEKPNKILERYNWNRALEKRRYQRLYKVANSVGASYNRGTFAIFAPPRQISKARKKAGLVHATEAAEDAAGCVQH